MNLSIPERVETTLTAFAQAQQRRARVAIVGELPPDLAGPVYTSGLVYAVVEPDASPDVVLVDWGALGEDPAAALRRLAWWAKNGIVLFDPRTTPPVAVRRAVREAWADHQAWVLPLDGQDAFSRGLVLATSAVLPDRPSISATMPVNLEEHDVERVLASFLPVCDEWVVGVDAKSADGTLEIVERYADVAFRFDIDPWSFAEARNRCIDRCSSPWIFMTEGHEHFDLSTQGTLRNIASVGREQGVVMVGRDTGGEGKNEGEWFFFPWVFRNHPALRFTDTGGVHNALDMEGYAEAQGTDQPVCVRMPGLLRTFHKAHETNRKARHEQRMTMNRQRLDEHADSGGVRKSRALFYAAQEHASAGDLRTAVRRSIEYLRSGDRFQEQLYEAHLRLGEFLMHLGRWRFASWMLRRALQHDVCRVEAELFLGDCYKRMGDLQAARQCYAKAAGVPLPDYTTMFVRKGYYRALPWRGLAATCLELGEHQKALDAARVALHFDPDDEVARKIVGHFEARRQTA